ncbi:unnamed protein product [Clonostachys chloroleuca]|uniref:Uncharacterized protein n=1 Tax=Clonostachys chloroleuca TaxID=1926264 RepID=A0AA35VKU1_9HYPO|nr:unnamed protein product [Clonostachys chloroleuca]
MSTLQASLELYQKLPVPVNEKTCSGKVYIVTGSNTGLGLETARHLVHASAARVILAVRNVAAGEKAKVDIEKSSPAKGVIDVWPLDLASFSSIHTFAQKVAELDRLDCLISNAGVMVDKWATVEGLETTVTVNVVSTMLLGALVMPVLARSGRMYSEEGDKPRLVFVVSTLGFQSKKELDKSVNGVVFEGLNDSKRADMDKRYAVTKLVEMFAVRQFASLYPVTETGVIVNMTAPGLCSTGLGHDARPFTRIWVNTARAMMARTAEEGSRAILFGAVANEESHGKLLAGCKIKDYWVPDWVTNKDGQQLQEKIWAELAGRLEETSPGCLSQIGQK